MHNHNKDGGGKGMMWMMIPCLLLLGVLFFGGSKLSSSGYLWLIVIGVCVVPHIWMMFKVPGGRGNHHGEEKIDEVLEKSFGPKDEHKRKDCCH